MFINANDSDKTIRTVWGLSDLEIALVKSYLQGCVYSWCNHKKTEAFKAQFFLGSDNYFWEGTPMFCLYAKRLREYGGVSEKACTQAARDAGHLLKALLLHDKRHFHTWTVSGYRWYQWDGVPDEDLPENARSYHTYITGAKNKLEHDVDSFV